MTGGGAGSALALAVALAVLACGAGACGGRPRSEATATGGRVSGREVFLSQCQGCHALGRLGARSPMGGDLVGYSMKPRDVASYARVMPTPRRLTRSELAAVAAFVSAGQRRFHAGSREGRRAGSRGPGVSVGQGGGGPG